MTAITRTRKTKPLANRGASAPPVLASPEAKAEHKYPERLRLTRPYGFIEETHNKGVFSWQAGEIVHNPVTIKLLITRNAPWEHVTDGPDAE